MMVRVNISTNMVLIIGDGTRMKLYGNDLSQRLAGSPLLLWSGDDFLC
jgi:hypothetical protein